MTRARNSHAQAPRPRRRFGWRSALTAVAVVAATIVPITVLGGQAQAATTIDTTAFYVLRNRASGKVLDVEGFATTDELPNLH